MSNLAANDRTREMAPIPCETYLFRHPSHFKLLESIASEWTFRSQPFRVLSAGCSTGEEAWSISAVLLSVIKVQSMIEVLGVDLEPERIDAAVRAQYSRWSLRGGLMGYSKWFVGEDSTLSPVDELRNVTRFEVANIADLRAEGPFDVIFFRNVGMYWQPEVCRTVFQLLDDHLVDGGHIMLGPGEAQHLQAGRFEMSYLSDGLVYRKGLPGTGPELTRPAASKPAMASAVAMASRAGSEDDGPAGIGADSTGPGAINTNSRGMRTGVNALAEIRALADSGHYDQAFQKIRLENWQSDPSLARLKGIVEINIGNFDQARESLRVAQYLAPNDPDNVRWIDLVNKINEST